MSGTVKHAERSHRNHHRNQKTMIDNSIKSAYRANLAKAAKTMRKEKKG